MAKGDVPSDWIFVPEAIASSGLVNDCDTGAGLVVRLSGPYMAPQYIARRRGLGVKRMFRERAIAAD